jgi:dTDP-4-amino-4,6-dideoxygalactose transaminase
MPWEASVSISFVDLHTQYERIESRIRENMNRVLEHGAYIMGPEIERLEEELAAFCGTEHAIACSSGTDALLLSLLALDVRPGDAVITTPFTFCATAETIALLGAVPVFADIDPETYNLDPRQAERAVEAVNRNDPALYPLPGQGFTDPPTVKGIVSVDLFGLPCDYDALGQIVEDRGLRLIVDAAQSLGSLDKGRSPCSLGDIACTSFFPAKPLGCYGDGGMCFTRDPDTAELLRSLRIHGRSREGNLRLGLNARMATLQAAVLLAKKEIFPEELERRRELARRYNRLLDAVPGIAPPPEFQDKQSAWAQYSLLARDERHRRELLDGLSAECIPWGIYYPHPLHLEPAFAHLGYREGDLPASEDAARRIFSLPVQPYLKDKDQEFIAEIVARHGTSR